MRDERKSYEFLKDCCIFPVTRRPILVENLVLPDTILLAFLIISFCLTSVYFSCNIYLFCHTSYIVISVV